MANSNFITILSERKCRRKHYVSYDIVIAQENAFSNEGAQVKCFSRCSFVINNILRKLGLNICLPDLSLFVKKVTQKNVLFIAMDIDDISRHKNDLKCIALSNQLGIYVFDAWESKYNELKDLLDFIKPSVFFFPYLESKKVLRKLLSVPFYSAIHG